MHPEYYESRQYHGASRYIAKHDFILTSLKLKKQLTRCKYETRAIIAGFVERDYIRLGKEYDINGILECILK